MEDHLAEFFARYLVSQIDRAELAARFVDEELQRIHEEPQMQQPLSTDAVWYHLENLLSALTSIANVLWTSNNKNPHKRRSKQLRAYFEIEHLTIDPGLRETRNSFEHLDERVDIWWAISERRNIADRNIGPKGMIQGLDESDFARAFDPTTGEISAFGKSVNLATVMAFVSELRPRIAPFTEPLWLRDRTKA